MAEIKYSIDSYCGKPLHEQSMAKAFYRFLIIDYITATVAGI